MFSLWSSFALGAALGLPQPMPSPSPSPVFQYYGGPVIEHARLTAVFWTKDVHSEIQAKVGDFYRAMANSTYMDWLKEYDTDTPNQHIGRGTYAGAVTLTPKDKRT